MDLRIAKARVFFDDGSICSADVSSDGSINSCIQGRIIRRELGEAYAFEINASTVGNVMLSSTPLLLEISGVEMDDALSLTSSGQVTSLLGKPYGYYNNLYIDRKPTTPQPPSEPEYPAPKSTDSGSIDCWSYPVILRSPMDIYPYTLFLLVRKNGKYSSLLALSNGNIASSIFGGPAVQLYTGRKGNHVNGVFLLSSMDQSDPYDAINKVVDSLFEVTPSKHRKKKAVPSFMEGLGWCSWNALLGVDLSHERVTTIVGDLIRRGVPISWVLIDDGWQFLVNGEMDKIDPHPDKFPHGFGQLISELKSIGVKRVGLWFTINMYWRGLTDGFLKELGAPAVKSSDGHWVPSPKLEESLELFQKFIGRIKASGFEFIKVDNQCSLRNTYRDISSIGDAARNVELGLQVASAMHGMDILNCMSMLPENYSNYLVSNSLRVSQDYVPMWIGDARLHIIWSFYNSIVYSKVGYPDFDMWVTYDPWAKISAVARVFSGGPIYITDRDPNRSSIELLSMMVMPSGEVVRVDEPALPTRDVLFKDPYNEEVLLKVSSTVNGVPVMAVMNLNKNGIEIEDEIDLSSMGMPSNGGIIYYTVFGGKYGVADNGKFNIKLKNLDAEIIVLPKMRNGAAVVGIDGYLLPPYPLTVHDCGNYCLTSKASGSLLVIDSHLKLRRHYVKSGEPIRVEDLVNSSIQ